MGIPKISEKNNYFRLEEKDKLVKQLMNSIFSFKNLFPNLLFLRPSTNSFPQHPPFHKSQELRMGYVLFLQVNDYEILGIMRW